MEPTSKGIFRLFDQRRRPRALNAVEPKVYLADALTKFA